MVPGSPHIAPHEAVTRINNIGKLQKMPTMLTYADRYGKEIPETIDDYPSDSNDDDSDDDTYSHPDQSNADSVFSADTDTSDDLSIDSTASANTDDDHLQPPPPPPAPTLLNNHPFAPAANQGVGNPGVGNYDFAPNADDASAQDPYEDNASIDTPKNEENEDNDTVNEEDDNGVSDNENNETNSEDETTQPLTESDVFCIAALQGRERAAQPITARPRRVTQPHRHDNFVYTFFEHMRNTIGSHLLDREFVHSYVTAQMSAKKGLKIFKEQGSGALMKELRQVVVMDVMSGCHARELSREQKKRALQYLMFLKQKRCGLIKGCGCVDGRPQRLWKTKEETTSPTVHDD
jgi:hypothetical protein